MLLHVACSRGSVDLDTVSTDDQICLFNHTVELRSVKSQYCIQQTCEVSMLAVSNTVVEIRLPFIFAGSPMLHSPQKPFLSVHQNFSQRMTYAQQRLERHCSYAHHNFRCWALTIRISDRRTCKERSTPSRICAWHCCFAIQVNFVIGPLYGD